MVGCPDYIGFPSHSTLDALSNPAEVILAEDCPGTAAAVRQRDGTQAMRRLASAEPLTPSGEFEFRRLRNCRLHELLGYAELEIHLHAQGCSDR